MRRVSPNLFWGVIGAVGVVVLALVLFGGTGKGGHRLVLRLAQASSVVAGQPVQAGGRKIGAVDHVKVVDGGRSAEVDMRIDDRGWPLTRGSKFDLRQGGTVSFFNHYILVTPGPASAPQFDDGAVVPSADVSVPAEFDQVVSTFNKRTRHGVKSMLDKAGPAFSRAGVPLRTSLRTAPDAVNQVAHVLGDLTSDRAALDTSIRTTSTVVDAIDRSDPSFGHLLDGAAGTFDAVADSERNLRVTLSRLPTALRQVQQFEKPIDSTLQDARVLIHEIAPGVTQLRAIARPLDGVLGSLQSVGPDAVSTLRTAGTKAPQVTSLLDSLTSISPRVQSTLSKANDQLHCLRPYTPELMGLTSTWGDFLSHDDHHDKILRAQILNFLPAFSNAAPYSPEDAKKLFPDLRYGFPRPPGYLAGQPWFLPECGLSKDVVDPSKDQEAKIDVGANGAGG